MADSLRVPDGGDRDPGEEGSGREAAAQTRSSGPDQAGVCLHWARAIRGDSQEGGPSCQAARAAPSAASQRSSAPPRPPQPAGSPPNSAGSLFPGLRPNPDLSAWPPQDRSRREWTAVPAPPPPRTQSLCRARRGARPSSDPVLGVNANVPLERRQLQSSPGLFRGDPPWVNLILNYCLLSHQSSGTTHDLIARHLCCLVTTNRE